MTERTRLTREELCGIKKLYVLLRVGLDDLKQFAETPNCYVEMSEWLRTTRNQCFACLAGAVIHQELGLDDHHEVEDGWLFALNNLRTGHVQSAYDRLNSTTRASLILPVEDRYMSEYGEEAWWPEMEQLYNELKEADL